MIPEIWTAIAWRSKQLEELFSCPYIWAPQAGTGKALSPAEPIIGLTLPPVSTLIILATITPITVFNINDTKPNTNINIVLKDIKVSAEAEEPIAIPISIVRIPVKDFCKVTEKFLIISDSLKILPKRSAAISGNELAKNIPQRLIAITANIIFSPLETCLKYDIDIVLSFFVVKNLVTPICNIGKSSI